MLELELRGTLLVLGKLVSIGVMVLLAVHIPNAVVLLALILLDHSHLGVLMMGKCLGVLGILLRVMVVIVGLGLKLLLLRNERGRGWLFRIFLSGLLHSSATSIVVD